MRNVLWLILITLGLAWGCGSVDTTTAPGAATAPTAGGGAVTTPAPGGTSAMPTGAAGQPSRTGAVGGSGMGATTAGTAASSAAGASSMMTAGTAAPAAGAPAMGTAGTAAPAAGTGAVAGTSGGAPSAMGTCGPPADTVDAEMGPGPWTPMHVENTGPTGSSWIFFPEGLGREGMKHPAFNWGPGAGTTASNYVDHLNHLASHGFVIISQSSTMSGTEAMDWLLKENESSGSMFYQKIDTMRVGRGGHSMGALQTMSESDDPRLTLYILVCGGCMSGNGGCGAANIHAPTIILGGVGEGGTVNFEGDYEEIPSPVVFVTKEDTDHIYCARNNLAPWTAFMRMTWCGEEAKYKPDFMEGGIYCKAPWSCKSKMF